MVAVGWRQAGWLDMLIEREWTLQLKDSKVIIKCITDKVESFSLVNDNLADSFDLYKEIMSLPSYSMRIALRVTLRITKY